MEKTNMSSHCGLTIVEYASLHKDNHTHTEDHTKGKTLNDYFYSRMMAAKHHAVFTYDCFQNIVHIEINIFGIRMQNSPGLPNATDPDHIPTKFLKLFAAELSPYLLLLL